VAWRHAAASAGRDWADVTRVPSGDERLQAVLSVTGMDSAGSAYRFRQMRRRGVETRETGNRLRRRHPVRTTGVSRSARPVIAESKDGKIRSAVSGSCSGNGAGSHAERRCVAKGIAVTHGSGVRSLSRPRAFTAPGASGVSSRDTERRFQDLRARRLNYPIITEC
jgi:hypothetical protein